MTTRKNALAVLLGLALIGLGGCTGKTDDGIPSAGSSASAGGAGSGPAPAEDPRSRLQQYVNCLRQHGVRVADPEDGKQVQLNEDRPEDKAAAQACRQYLPPAVSIANGGNIDTMRQYARCMREHGLPEFPDPDPERGMQLPKSLLNDSHYASADQVCSAQFKGGTGGK